MSTLTKVQAIIADALYMDAEQVTADANLMRDLGAESIDFLDIIFRLEKEFGIKIPKGDIERRAKGDLTDEQFAVGGRLTDAALVRVRALLSELNPAEVKPGLMVRDIASLFTVQTFVRMVEEQLGGGLAVPAIPATNATVGA